MLNINIILILYISDATASKATAMFRNFMSVGIDPVDRISSPHARRVYDELFWCHIQPQSLMKRNVTREIYINREREREGKDKEKAALRLKSTVIIHTVNRCVFYCMQMQTDIIIISFKWPL